MDQTANNSSKTVQQQCCVIKISRYNPTGSIYAPRCPYDLTLENELGDFSGPGSREYGSEVTYECPLGYALDLSEDERTERPQAKTWTCETYGLWAPQIQPKCIRESCICI